MILRRIYINGFACCSLAWLMPTTWIRSGLCIRNKQPGVGNMILWKRWRIGLMSIWNRLRQMHQHLSSMRNGRLSCPVAGRWPRAFPAFLAWQFRQVGERHWRRWLGHSSTPFVTKKNGLSSLFLIRVLLYRRLPCSGIFSERRMWWSIIVICNRIVTTNGPLLCWQRKIGMLRSLWRQMCSSLNRCMLAALRDAGNCIISVTLLLFWMRRRCYRLSFCTPYWMSCRACKPLLKPVFCLLRPHYPFFPVGSEQDRGLLTDWKLPWQKLLLCMIICLRLLNGWSCIGRNQAQPLTSMNLPTSCPGMIVCYVL